MPGAPVENSFTPDPDLDEARAAAEPLVRERI
jgi:hypothetical protein